MSAIVSISSTLTSQGTAPHEVREEEKALLAAVPQKWRHLRRLLEDHGWTEDRISGIHYVFIKPGHRCIPLAFHGASVSKRYAKLVLQQAKILTDTNDKCTDATVLEAFDEEEVIEDPTSNSGRSLAKDNPLCKRVSEKRTIPPARCLTEVTDLENLQLMRQAEMLKEKACVEQKRQIELLDAIQCEITAGEFARALELIKGEHLDLVVGSSNIQFRFASDLNFFKLVALMERAFDEFPFDSKQQQESIIEILKQASRFMEVVCDRRNEVRLLGMSLQRRVIEQYLERAGAAYEQYMNVYVRGFVPGGKEASNTPNFVYAQTDTILSSLKFIVSMHQLVKSQPFLPEREIGFTAQFQITMYMPTCIQRMLVLFDSNAFVASEDAADTLLLATEAISMIPFNIATEAIRISMIPFNMCLPPPARVESKWVAGIAKHIKDLSPLYQFARQDLTWSRFAGVVVRSIEMDEMDDLKYVTCDFESALTFADRVIAAISKTQECVHDLVTNHMTRTFMFDTLLDPIMLLQYAVQDICSNKKHLVGSLLCDHFTGFANAADKNSKLKEFRKAKYNELRRRIIRGFDRLQTLANIYDSYFEILDEEGRDQIDIRTPGIKKARFELINLARYDLVFLFTFFFDEASIESLTLTKCLTILRADLDIARMFHMDFPSKLKGNCQSGPEIFGLGRYSFNISFQFMIPRILEKHVFEEEILKRLYVLNNLGNSDEFSMVGLDGILRFVECKAFALLSQLLQLKQSISESFVRDFLHTSAKYADKSTEYRHWEKNMAKKFTKKIEQLVRSAREQERQLRSCLQDRTAAVASLMAKLDAYSNAESKTSKRSH